MPNRGHIVIFNDNPVEADVLQELLETNGYRVDKQANWKKFRKKLKIGIYEYI